MANIDYDECRLLNLRTWQAKLRVSAEITMTLGAILYIIAALREARFLGRRMFLENLVPNLDFQTFPVRSNFLLLDDGAFESDVFVLVPYDAGRALGALVVLDAGRGHHGGGHHGHHGTVFPLFLQVLPEFNLKF